jgi:hypothetical protein
MLLTIKRGYQQQRFGEIRILKLHPWLYRLKLMRVQVLPDTECFINGVQTMLANLSRFMISHCANPDCGVPLRRLRDGRLFQFEITSPDNGESQSKLGNRGKSSRRVAHFWLCGKCSPSFTLVVDPKRGVAVVPLYSAKSASS